MKTLAIRLQDEQHARLHLLAKVSGDTVTEVIREALEQRLDALANDAELAAKAEAVLADMEARAAAERDALAALIGNGTTPIAKTTRPKPSGQSK